MHERERISNENLILTPLRNSTVVNLLEADSALLGEKKRTQPEEILTKNVGPVFLTKMERKSRSGSIPETRFECPLCKKTFSQKFLGKLQNMHHNSFMVW